MYGRGVNSIAEQIECTIQEAQSIIDNFYKSFPQVKGWMENSEAFAKKTGYVEDLWGRRRRLPDILLPKFTIKYKTDKDSLGDFNPFLGCKNRIIADKTIESYKKQLEEARSRKQIEAIKAKADKEDIVITNNGGFISQAQRQCVNARIQGSAATMTKKAMIKIYNDEELKDLDFKLLIGVHDELIGECPIENSERVAELLTKDMRTCAEDSVTVPFKCDAELSYNWYFNPYMGVIKKEYTKLLEGDKKKGILPLSEKEAFSEIVKNHTELTEDNLKEILYRDFETQSDDDWKTFLEEQDITLD